MWIVFFAFSSNDRILWGDENYYITVARDIAAGRDPDLLPLWPILYPLFLSLFVKLGLESYIFYFQLLLFFYSIYLLYVMLLSSGIEKKRAQIASLIALATPEFLFFAFSFWPEVIYLFLFVFSLHLYFFRKNVVLGPFFMGLAGGIKEIATPFLTLYFFLTFLKKRGLKNFISFLSFFAGLCVVLFLNLYFFKEPFIAASAPFNLWVGITDKATGNFEDDNIGEKFSFTLQRASSVRDWYLVPLNKVVEYITEGSFDPIYHIKKQYMRLLDYCSFLCDMLPEGRIWSLGYGWVSLNKSLGSLLSILSSLYYLFVLMLIPSGMYEACKKREVPFICFLLSFVFYTVFVFSILHVKTRYRFLTLLFLTVFVPTKVKYTHLLFAIPLILLAIC